MNAISGNPDFLYSRYTNSAPGTRSSGEGISAQADLSDLADEATVPEEKPEAVSDGMLKAMSSGYTGASALTDKLNELLGSGIITEDEKEDLLSALKDAMPSPPPIPPEMAESLDNLVAAGTISEDQEDAVISALESFNGSSPNPLQNLADEGTLTQSQMDAISSTFQNMMRMKRAQEAYGAVMSGWTKRE
jgi:hypothetical protein